MSERLYNVVMCDLGSNEIIHRHGSDLTKDEAVKLEASIDCYHRDQMYTAFEVDEAGFYGIADCI